MHFHLNTLKFLEDYCTNCLKVASIRNNGDGTVDLTVALTHPFPGHPELTGFDVKGIMMFDGSCEFRNQQPLFLLPDPFYVSWRLMGDPEVLNPDGYTPRWSPNWESGSDLPIFNYWEGKFSRGLPNADLNAYKDFYSSEERHVFTTYSRIERTYKIWLPPGQAVVAGYAVEACWEPPTTTPVKNPIDDFPLSANQPEAYYFRYVVNNGEEITNCEEWPTVPSGCDVMYVEMKQWGGLTADRFARLDLGGGGSGFDWRYQCDPPVENRFGTGQMAACKHGNGTFRGVCLNWRMDNEGYARDIAYTVFDWTVNDPNID